MRFTGGQGGAYKREEWMDTFGKMAAIINRRVYSKEGPVKEESTSIAREIMVELYGLPPKPSYFVISRTAWRVAAQSNGAISVVMRANGLAQADAAFLRDDITRALESLKEVEQWEEQFGETAVKG